MAGDNVNVDNLGEAATHGASASGSGMPQLDFATYPHQIFWLIITLLAIYFVMSRFALPRISSVLSERAATVTNDIAAAEELKQMAEAAGAAYEKALVDARAEASRIVAEAKAEIQAELDVEMKKADAAISAKTAESEKAIARIREGAVKIVSEVAKDVAKEIVSALGGKVEVKAVTAAVTARMKG